jgi:hypothetical protein
MDERGGSGKDGKVGGGGDGKGEGTRDRNESEWRGW